MDTPPPKSEATTPASKPGTPAKAAPAAAAAQSQLEKTLTADGSPIESRLLAYRALKLAAKEIGEEVAKVKPVRVVLHNDAEITAVTAYQAFVTQLRQLAALVDAELKDGRNQLVSLKGPFEALTIAVITATVTAVAGAVAAVGGLLRSALDIVAMFRDSVSLDYHDVAVADSALVAAVCNQLVYQKITVFNPATVPPGLGSTASAIGADLDALAKSRVDLDGVLKDVATFKTKLTAEIAAIDKDIAAHPDDEHLKERRADRQRMLTAATALEQRLTAVAASVDAFRTALVKVDDTTGVMPFSKILKAEKLAVIIANAHLLSLKVSGGGGGLESRENNRSAAERRYSGAAIVEFILFAPDGHVACADLLPAYSGLVKVIEGERSVDLTDIDSL